MIPTKKASLNPLTEHDPSIFISIESLASFVSNYISQHLPAISKIPNHMYRILFYIAMVHSVHAQIPPGIVGDLHGEAAGAGDFEVALHPPGIERYLCALMIVSSYCESLQFQGCLLALNYYFYSSPLIPFPRAR